MPTNVASGNGLVVVTHVYREQDVQKGDVPSNVVVPPLPSSLGNGNHMAGPPQCGAVAPFIRLVEPVMKREQTTVGIVQVLLGVIIFLFGIVRAAENYVTSAKSGVMFWGSIIHIIAGCVTVQAKMNPTLDKTLLGMNILSSVIATAGIVLYSLDFNMYYYCNSEITGDGISGIMILFCVAEFVISAAVSICTYYAIPSFAPEVVSNQRDQYLPPTYESVSSVINTSETTVFPSAVPTSIHTNYDKPEDLPSTA